MFPWESCHFFDAAHHICSIYERRPLVCRTSPLICDVDTGKVDADTINCIEARRIFASSKSEGVVKCPEEASFGTVFGHTLHYVAFAAVLKEFVTGYVESLRDNGRVKLLPFKPKDLRRALTGAEFTKVDVNALYEKMEGRSFKEDVLAVFRTRLEKDLNEAGKLGLSVLETVDEVMSNIHDLFLQ